MRLYLLIGLLVHTCLARPDVSHLPSIYLPSTSGSNLKTYPIDTRVNQGSSGLILIRPKSQDSATEAAPAEDNEPEGNTTEYSIEDSTTTDNPDYLNNGKVNNPLYIGGAKPLGNEIASENRFNLEASAAGIGDFSIVGAPLRNSGGRSLPTGSYLPDSGIQVIGSESSGGDGSYLGLPGSSSGQQGGPQRSVYYFAAPDEESQARFKIQILPSAQASSRVIFIKAPSYAAPIPEVISAPSLTDEKTVIYVLSKRPGAVSPISIPTSTVQKQAKPKIVFVKYGSKEEAERAVADGLKGGSVGSNLQDLQDAQSFINAIKEAGIKESNIFGPAGESGPYF